MMKDDDFKLFRGFADRQTNERTDGQTDICECRVAFTTEKFPTKMIFQVGTFQRFSLPPPPPGWDNVTPYGVFFFEGIP